MSSRQRRIALLATTQRMLDQRCCKRNSKPFSNDQSNDAQAPLAAAQTDLSTRSASHRSQKNADQRIQLVRQASPPPSPARSARRRPARPACSDRGSRRRRRRASPSRAGVVAAHQALQLGELADHVGDEVGLARGARRVRPGRPSSPSPLRGRGRGEGLSASASRVAAPPRPLPLTGRGLTIPSSTSQRASFATRSTLSATVPSFSWKMIRSSFFACSSSGILRSCSQKKRASRQPRGEHLAVAVDDRRAAVGRVDVGGADEGVGQLARPRRGRRNISGSPAR